MQQAAHPELEYMYHVPNGGSRNKAEAARLKAQGVKSGVPDICLPVPRGGYNGLYIELKRIGTGRESDNQKKWLAFLAVNGYCVATIAGWEAAARHIMWYLRLKKEGDA